MSAILLTDLDYDIFIKQNSFIFKAWKGGLTHDQLCRLDLETRFKYWECLEEQLRKEEEQITKAEAKSASRGRNKYRR